MSTLRARMNTSKASAIQTRDSMSKFGNDQAISLPLVFCLACFISPVAARLFSLAPSTTHTLQKKHKNKQKTTTLTAQKDPVLAHCALCVVVHRFDRRASLALTARSLGSACSSSSLLRQLSHSNHRRSSHSTLRTSSSSIPSRCTACRQQCRSRNSQRRPVRRRRLALESTPPAV